MEEAAAIRVVLKHDLLGTQTDGATLQDVNILLLAELQSEQDREMARIMSKIARLVSWFHRQFFRYE